MNQIKFDRELETMSPATNSGALLVSVKRWEIAFNDPVIPLQIETRAASHLRGQNPPLPDVPRGVHELLARRAGLPEVQEVGSMARLALKVGKNHALIVQPDMTVSDPLAAVVMVPRS